MTTATKSTWSLEWRAYGPNHGRSEYYGEAEWQAACRETGIDPEGRYDTIEAAEAARDTVDEALIGLPHLISVRVVADRD